MNRIYKVALSLLVLATSLSTFAQDYQNRILDESNMREGENVEYCSQHKKMIELLKDPVKFKLWQADKAAAEQHYQQFVSNRQNSYDVDTVPIVFHVLHNEGVEKISRAQVLDALDILNRDFSKQNADTANVLSMFQPIIGNPNIHFALATKAPNGQCFSGITYTSNPASYTEGDDGFAQVDAIVSGNDVYNGEWPGDEYLNIFICGDIGGAAGYVWGWSEQSNAMENGVWILYNYVGSIESGSAFRSRSLTHEVGHWLNLSHPWGSTNNPGQQTCGTDNVADTPTTQGSTSCNLSEDYCGPVANVENYMDYSYCSKMFTEGQVDRMRAALTNPSWSRKSVVSDANMINTGVRNPAMCKAQFEADQIVICEGQTVDFSDASYHNANDWTWTFAGGNPSSSTDQNPTVSYSTAGTYAVTLVASDGSTSDTETKTNYITVLPSIGRPMQVQEGFETLTLPDDEWIVYNPDGAASWSISTAAGASGSKSLRLLNMNNDEGDVDEFISSTIDLSGVTDFELAFKYAFAKKSSDNTDYLRISASNDCGESWSVRKNISATSIATANNTTGNFVPNSSQWETVVITNITSSYWNSDFRFKIQFVSGGGNNVYIDDINLYDPNAASISENNEISLFRVYPNPAKDMAKVSFELIDNSNVKIALSDMLGQEIKVVNQSLLNAGSHQFEINTNELSSGVYFINLTTEGKMTSKKLIVE